MPTAVIMPKYEMTQETGTVGTWLKAEGEFVRKGEVILEIETDKVSMDVESPADGTLVAISAGPGQVVPVGQPIAYLLREGETWPEQSSEPAQTSAEPAPAVKSESPRSARPWPPARWQHGWRTSWGSTSTVYAGSGPRGKVTRKDIENHMSGHCARRRRRWQAACSSGSPPAGTRAGN